MNQAKWALLGGVGFLFAGCGSSLPTAAIPASGTFSAVYANTLKTACIECHKPTGAATMDNHVALDFTTQATAYQTLTTSAVTGLTSAGICPGVKIVVASNAANSYLAGVLFTDYNHTNFASVSGCTPYSVHLQDQNLSAAEKTSLINWIQGGALNN